MFDEKGHSTPNYISCQHHVLDRGLHIIMDDELHGSIKLPNIENFSEQDLKSNYDQLKVPFSNGKTVIKETGGCRDDMKFLSTSPIISLREKLHEIEALLDQLDKRVASLEELEYFSENVQKTAKVIAKIYFVVYVGTGVSGILTVLMNSERRLMYPAWFPFDWNSSLLVYRLTLFYQAFGVTVQIVQNMVNDIFTPVMLCLMAGHVRLLGMRLRKIGNDQKRNSNHHLEVLKNCMENHIQLRQLFKTAEDSLSLVQLLLFISSGLNICVTLVYLLFYVNSFVGVLYYTIFLTAITMEVFPIYFYGSVVQQEFEDLTYAMFCSNWIEQPQIFRRNMLIFLQNTLPKMRMVGGGIVGIQLDTFFLICRSTYSIFTLIRNINRDN
ncbi:odorant receptor 33a-like [Stomoxys calcitrans]|uniref:odorant receptor 33a-like n=1 Tax=Stomoxys calcitrans TaxID=35570 RepID=UPI0027E37121|nr:odorant receptor 33a-like [Stomoxys calcitrans]